MIEGYGTRALSRSQARRMLGFERRAEVNEVMNRAASLLITLAMILSMIQRQR